MRSVALAAVLVAGCNAGLPSAAPGAATTDGAAGPDLGLAADLAQAPPDLVLGQPSSVYPAPFPAPPQVESEGGTVLVRPRLVPMFFSNDDPRLVAQAVDFETRVGATAYWQATTAEYGVGPATASPAVMLAETSSGTIDDRQIGAWLQAKINAADPELPAPTTGDIYVIHYPLGTTITLQGTRSCASFGAYHANTFATVNKRRSPVAYAVIPRCAGNGRAPTIDDITTPTSHELVEAVTDPYPYSSPLGYASVDGDHAFWGLRGGELGDMCEGFSSSFMRFPPELPFEVQRTWSNASVAAGKNPCVPAPAGEVYFNAVPEAQDPVTIKFGQQSFDVLGVQVPLGTSKTVLLDLYSDGPTGGPWTVSVDNINPQRAYLSFSLDRDSGQNGEKLQLTITSVSPSPSGAARYVIRSQLGDVAHSWFGEVGQ